MISSWVVFIAFIVGSAVLWRHQFIHAAVILAALATLFPIGLLLSRLELRHRQLLASQLPADATCVFARSFDFRQTDTLVMRAVYEELQPEVPFSMLASHRLIEDLQLDDEDLIFDYVPIIARRLGRTLRKAKKNPCYGHVQTVADLVHFLAAQPLVNGARKA